MILGLVGCGHIGGSLARALRSVGAADRVVGHDRDPEVARRARELGIVDEIGALDEIAGGADVVVLAVPVLSIPALGEKLAPALRAETVVTDVGSTKRSVVAALDGTLRRFVGGHPMAGSERAGPDAASDGLFAGKKVILTPTATTDREALAAVAAMWRATGATIVYMDADRHDRVVAAVSHLPHAVAYALCSALADQANELRGLSGGGFVDTTRIAATPPGMWVDVFVDNRDRVVELLDRFGAEVRALRDAVADGDARAIEGLLERARAARGRIVG